jgi:hypothetical protein
MRLCQHAVKLYYDLDLHLSNAKLRKLQRM